MVKYIFICLVFVLFFCILYWLYYAIRMRNPYKQYFIFGKKGSGKSSFLIKIAFKYIKRGWTVYATTEIPGTYFIDPQDIGKFKLKPNSVLLIDEVSLIWSNRDWKNFQKTTEEYFRKNRHERCAIYMASQTFDVDRIVRDTCDKMYMLVNYANCLTVCKEIKRKLTVVKPSEDAESRIADELVISPFFLAPFGARIFVWIPRFMKYFDSFEPLNLPKKDFEYVEFPEGVKPITYKKYRRRRRQRERKKRKVRRSR